MKKFKHFLILSTLFFSSGIFAQSLVKGIVVDTENQPIPGINIVVKGTNNGTASDFDGNFTIEVESGSTLIISSIGYITQEVLVTDVAVLMTVILSTDVLGLNEVVVTGYGTQKKVNLTGAVAAVSGEVLEDRPILNVGEGLQGVIPNLNIDIRNIEGDRSIVSWNWNFGDNTPADSARNPLSFINSSDIESISVLKDASATAIYGARGANGVY